MNVFDNKKNVNLYCMDKRRKILKEARQYAKNAKKMKPTGIELTLESGTSSSLGRIVNTKEKADLFMKMLKAL
jgi:hypothetical protein